MAYVDYICDSCGNKTEVIINSNTPQSINCFKCESGKMQKVFPIPNIKHSAERNQTFGDDKSADLIIGEAAENRKVHVSEQKQIKSKIIQRGDIPVYDDSTATYKQYDGNKENYLNRLAAEKKILQSETFKDKYKPFVGKI